ncbi:pseudouridine synthase [soil metagenome]
MLIAFWKPYGVLTQFTDPEGRSTLTEYIEMKGVYPAGRLDTDSEGLLLLTDDGRLQARLADPKHKVWKTYLAQVEGEPAQDVVQQLADGVDLNDGRTRPARAKVVEDPGLPPRLVPIRTRANIPTAWIELALQEGRNRQVRRMTAAVGHPTLRLVRTAYGPYTLDGMMPGAWKELNPSGLRRR